MSKWGYIMKLVDRMNMSAKNYSLKADYGFPDYSPYEYPCTNCGKQLRLYQTRVLYCTRCHKGKLHPRYNFALDRIV